MSDTRRVRTRTAVMRAWYRRAQIDYTQQYMALYAAFNGWYTDLTGKTSDREALTVIGRGNGVWERYCRGEILSHLVEPMKMLVEFTLREPISFSAPHWRGEVGSIYDWTSVIEYWYRVRCLVMHGAEINPQYVYVAYETLNIFMEEVLKDIND